MSSGTILLEHWVSKLLKIRYQLALEHCGCTPDHSYFSQGILMEIYLNLNNIEIRYSAQFDFIPDPSEHVPETTKIANQT